MKKLFIMAMALVSTTAFAESFKIDTGASTILWKAGKKIGTFHNGSIKFKTGTVDTDKSGSVSAAKIVVDMKTIANEDLKEKAEYQKKLVDHLSSSDFFDVEKHPESTFEITSVTPKAGSKDEFTVKGKFTMIGNTQDIEFPAKISADKSSVKGTATIVVERLKWGLKYGSGSLFKSLTADKIINDTFELSLSVVAKK
ncbi:MAG: YCE I like family protein [Proteobacteria bacterium SG_bin7]|nr:MAG: YCE I like family protein [Proteobacteria bacterium SG_bin7]